MARCAGSPAGLSSKSTCSTARRTTGDFWINDGRESDTNIQDGQSVIYFHGGGDPDRAWSFAHRRWSSEGMVEADIYINTTDEETYCPNLARTTLVLPMNDTHGIHAYVNLTYVTNPCP